MRGGTVAEEGEGKGMLYVVNEREDEGRERVGEVGRSGKGRRGREERGKGQKVQGKEGMGGVG